MQDSAKYLIHADIRASGVVERSDVVGAIFGQTEGLLGEELDLRELQESAKVGRIDVEIESEAGRSFGTVTIASGLDRAETAVLAAALETIDRVGPCRAELEVTELEDARAAKRREVVARATELLAEFEETALTSQELVEAVRRNVRVEDITDYEGLPAGPRVADSDAIIVVEGRADVSCLLRYGIKNAVAVEGTDVPEAIAALTEDRTVTAFLDGDRGGDLILKELAQVGTVDYVTFAPAGRSVEDLSRTEVLSALRKKVPYERVDDAESPRSALAVGGGTGGSTSGDGGEVEPESAVAGAVGAVPEGAGESADQPSAVGAGPESAGPVEGGPERQGSSGESRPEGEAGAGEGTDASGEDGTGPETLADHVEAVIGGGTGRVRLLDGEYRTLAETDAEGSVEAIESAETVPATVVLDATLSQRVLDVAAQRGVGQVVAREEGEFVKQPTGVRVRTAEAHSE